MGWLQALPSLPAKTWCLSSWHLTLRDALKLNRNCWHRCWKRPCSSSWSWCCSTAWAQTGHSSFYQHLCTHHRLRPALTVINSTFFVSLSLTPCLPLSPPVFPVHAGTALAPVLEDGFCWTRLLASLMRACSAELEGLSSRHPDAKTGASCSTRPVSRVFRSQPCSLHVSGRTPGAPRG